MTQGIIWSVDSFDSETVGIPMAKISALPEDQDLAAQLLRWKDERAAEGLRHASTRLTPDQTNRIIALEDAGFRCVDSLITLAFAGAAPQTLDPRVMVAEAGDLESIVDLSQGLFDQTRYALDPWMPPGAADRVVAAWVRNNLQGRADRTWLAKVDGEAAGFLSSLWRPEQGHAVIDLIAVDRRFQGKGLGRALTLAMVSHYFGTAPKITVGTQAANLSALSLYQAAGFRVMRFELGFSCPLKS